jgi:hypothetical protein
MTSLFEWYMHFSDNLYNRELAFMDFVYPFPDTEGIKAEGTIRGSICSYISYPLAELNKRIFKSANRFVVNVVYILKDCKCTYFP